LVEHDTTENRFLTELAAEPFVLRDGAYDVPSVPGLGIELDQRAIDRLRV
jgi:D-galactarolactone cycloisomerase